MNKFDEFKAFAQTKPFLKERVKNKETTWQELYERYDIYGENDEAFQEPSKNNKEEQTIEEEKKDNKDGGLGSLFDVLASFDADKITEGLNGMKKILNVLAEVTASDEPSVMSKRKMSRPYSRDDD